MMAGPILITGATGFIGGHLVNKLSQQERSLALVSRHGSDISTPLDLTLERETNKVVSSLAVRTVVHLASGVRSIQSNADIDREVDMAINVLSALKPPCRFIYLSTADEYASSPNPISEESELDPVNMYAKAKLKAREKLEILAAKMGVELVVLRPFLVYGPFQPKHMFISQLLTSVSNKTRFVYSKKKKVRDYVHVSDVVKAIVMLIDCKTVIRGTYNIGTGIGTSLSEVVKIVEKNTNKMIDIEQDQRLGIDSPDILIADTEKISTEIGWFPRVELSEGLLGLINIE